jgi:hypothetical protein
MGVVLNTLFITVISVLIIDISGVVDDIKRLIFRLLNGKQIKYKDYNIRPFDCSFCFSFWTNLIFLIVTNSFSIHFLMMILIYSWSTIYIKEIFILLDSWLIKLFNMLTPNN